MKGHAVCEVEISLVGRIVIEIDVQVEVKV